jgi:hypothetical protein
MTGSGRLQKIGDRRSIKCRERQLTAAKPTFKTEHLPTFSHLVTYTYQSMQKNLQPVTYTYRPFRDPSPILTVP